MAPQERLPLKKPKPNQQNILFNQFLSPNATVQALPLPTK